METITTTVMAALTDARSADMLRTQLLGIRKLLVEHTSPPTGNEWKAFPPAMQEEIKFGIRREREVNG